MDIDHYKSFDVEDFILDENLAKLVKGQTVEGMTLAQYKKLFPDKSNEITLAVDILMGLKTTKKTTSEARKGEILNAILQSKNNRVIINILRYAATVLLIVGLAASYMWLNNAHSEIEDYAAAVSLKSKNAELILADGKRVEFKSKQSKIEYINNSSSVSLNDSSKLEQPVSGSGKCYNQVIVPFGKRSHIIFSDGSKVWLNSGSRLVYPPVFNGVHREVFLEGEAYFEVAKNKNMPFIVRTSNFRIKVLGTRFNVQAYKNESEQTTVLLEGKVNIGKCGELFSNVHELTPNNKATLLTSEDDFTISNVGDAENYIAWTYGYLPMENQDILSLTRRISRYYNIDIEVTAKNVPTRFAGKLDLKEDPERIVEGLATIFKLKHRKEGEKIVIYE